MPRRITEFRLLAEPLRAWLSELDGVGDDRWPKYKQLFQHMRSSLDWSGSEREYKILRQQGYGPARLVEGVLEYLCLHGRRHLDPFLPSQGLPGGVPYSVEGLLEQFSAHCDETQIQTDWRNEGWRMLMGMFSAALLGVDERSLCRSEQEVCDLVRWAMTDVGRGLAGDPQGLQPRDSSEFLAHGEFHMGRSLAQFQAQALGWWEESPWSVLKSVCGEEQVGGSIVLPLHRWAYEDLRRGRLSDLELTPDLLQVPSRYFLGEAMATSLPTSVRTRVGWATARQGTTIIYQIARQSFTTKPQEGAGQPFRVLCVGGTPFVEQRLERHGYTRVGPLKGFEVPLYELVMPAPETQGWFPTSASRAYAAVIAACHAQLRRAAIS